MPRRKKKYETPAIIAAPEQQEPDTWPRYMTYKVAAKYTSSSYNAIRQLVLAGQLRVVAGLFGRANKVDRAEIDELFQRKAAAT